MQNSHGWLLHFLDRFFQDFLMFRQIVLHPNQKYRPAYYVPKQQPHMTGHAASLKLKSRDLRGLLLCTQSALSLNSKGHYDY